MKPEDWDAGFGRSIGMFLNGNGIRGTDTRGQRVVDDSFLLLFNAHDEGMDWVLPPEEFAPAWRLVIDTSGVPELTETIAGGGIGPGGRQGHWWCCRRWPRSRSRRASCRPAAAVPTIAPVPVPMRPEALPRRRLRHRCRAESRTEQPGSGRARRIGRTGRGSPRPRRPASRARRSRSGGFDDRERSGRPGLHLPAADHRRLDAGRRGRPGAVPATLGVDWVYLSPMLAAEPGPGTATTSSTTVRWTPTGAATPACGSSPRRRTAPATGVLVDIVPNHVGVATPQASVWWWDVLTHGPDSRLRRAFDIDWAVSAGQGPAADPRRRGRRAGRAADRGRRAAVLRSPVPDRPGHRRRHPARGAWPVSTTS